MKALEVFINGQRVCLAGVGDNGVLNTIVNWVGRPVSVGEKDQLIQAEKDDEDYDGERDDLFLSIGGLNCESGEHFRWKSPTIKVGDEVLVKILAAAIVDPPNEKITYEKQTCVDQYRKHLKQCSGWLTPEERNQMIKELVAELQSHEG